MKHLLLSISLIALLASCGGDYGNEINVEDIDSPCECVEAMNALAMDIIAAAGDKKESELEEDLEFVAQMDKMEQLEDKCQEYKKKDVEDCDGFEDVRENMDKMEDLF